MLHFAPRHGIVSTALVRGPCQRLRLPANDNLAHNDPGVIGDARVQAALRLFAAHGLGAAARARTEAANANARGDLGDARWWDEISRMLG